MITNYLQVNEKIKLAYFCEHSPNSKVGIIIIHGLAEHKGRYDYFINKLYSNDISAFAVDLRGHGESSGVRGDVDDFQTFICDLKFFIEHVKKMHPHLKLALFGHSLGGLVASACISQYNNADLLILSSPLLVPHKASRLLKFVPYKHLKFIRFKKRHSESPEMLAYSYSDPLSSNSFSLRLIGVMFDQGINYVIRNLGKISVPILILGGEYDPLIDSSKFLQLSQSFSSKDMKLKVYAGVRHRLVQGNHKDMVISEITQWINSKLE